MSGELKKLKIKAIEESGDVTSNPDLIYDALVNPETFKINHTIEYSEFQPAGTTGQDRKYIRSQPQTIQFDFLFDSTGVIPKPLTGIAGALSGVPIAGAIASAIAGSEEYDIFADIEKFKKVVYNYYGETHSPNKVQLLWGTLFFEGVLTSVSFNFKLFKPDGTPIRVVASASFTGSIADDLRVAMEKSSSPDLTHLREVKLGDTLPLMSYKIYGDSSYYMEIARVNNLNNFRDLIPGTKLKFPPIEKSKK